MEEDAYEIFGRVHRIYIKGMRIAIAEGLQEAYGAEWWDRGVLPSLGENQRENLERELQKGFPEDLKELLDTSHFARIVQKNHAAAFANAFSNIDRTLKLFSHLSVRRNEWAHVLDGKWKISEIMQSVQAMREILVSLRRREGLEIHQMFGESLELQEGVLEEEMNDLEELSQDLEDDIVEVRSHLSGFWREVRSYLSFESSVLPQEPDEVDRRGRKYALVLMRVTNTAPSREGQPDICFREVELRIHSGNSGTREINFGGIGPGESREEQVRFPENSLGFISVQVIGQIDHDRLFRIQREDGLPSEVVKPLIEQLSGRLESVAIEEFLDKVVRTAAKIQPAMTLLEVSEVRRELGELRSLSAEKREAIGTLFNDYDISGESSLGVPLREVISLLENLENDKLSSMDSAIGETDLESIRTIASDIENAQIAVLRVRDTIRERVRARTF